MYGMYLFKHVHYIVFVCLQYKTVLTLLSAVLYDALSYTIEFTYIYIYIRI